MAACHAAEGEVGFGWLVIERGWGWDVLAPQHKHILVDDTFRILKHPCLIRIAKNVANLKHPYHSA